jgi:hypothetical protein
MAPVACRLSPNRVASEIEVRSTPHRREQVLVKLTFSQSLAEISLLAARLGDQIDPDSTRWEFEELVNRGVEPEGNVVQLLQLIPG